MSEGSLKDVESSVDQIAASRRLFLTKALGGMTAVAAVGVAGASVAQAQFVISGEALRILCNSPQAPSLPECNCFLRGTLIATPYGEAAIEDLRTGDVVRNISGDVQEVRWVARSRYNRSKSGLLPISVAPVLVRKGALGNGTPTSDLYVSEGHCFYIEGQLYPIGQLVNGRSIVKISEFNADAVEYFHIELARHDIVIANGAATESLQGGKSRVLFDNYTEYADLYGSDLPVLAPFATIHGNFGRRQEIASKMRDIVSSVYDIRTPISSVKQELARFAPQFIAA